MVNLQPPIKNQYSQINDAIFLKF